MRSQSQGLGREDRELQGLAHGSSSSPGEVLGACLAPSFAQHKQSRNARVDRTAGAPNCWEPPPHTVWVSFSAPCESALCLQWLLPLPSPIQCQFLSFLKILVKYQLLQRVVPCVVPSCQPWVHQSQHIPLGALKSHSSLSMSLAGSFSRDELGLSIPSSPKPASQISQNTEAAPCRTEPDRASRSKCDLSINGCQVPHEGHIRPLRRVPFIQGLQGITVI